MLNAIQGLSLLALLWCYIILSTNAQVTLSSLRVENNLALVGPLVEPFFSWTFGSPEHEVVQTSYQILVSKSRPGGEDVWNSGVTVSNRTEFIRYTGPQLTLDTHYIWSVNASTSAGLGVASSEFVTGPSSPSKFYSRQVENRTDTSSPTLTFNSLSSWIWTADADLNSAPEGERIYRRTFDTPPNRTAVSALVLLSVDNEFSLYVNRNVVGTSGDNPDWRQARWYNIILAPDTTRTDFAIRGINNLDSNNQPSPAGVLAAIRITFAEGKPAFLFSDGNWRSNSAILDGSPSSDDASWPPVKVLAEYGEGPWRKSVRQPRGPPSSTTLTSTTSSTSSPTSSTSSPSASSSSTVLPTPGAGTTQNVGVIVGAVLGSIIIILLVLVAYLWYRQKPRHHTLPAQLLHHPLDLEYGDRNSIQSMSQYVPSSVSSLRYFPSISPSMSISAVAERSRRNRDAMQRAEDNAYIETRVRVQRLEELVLALDREIASGDSDSLEVARLRARVTELTEQLKTG